MTRCFIALGANLGLPLQQIQSGLACLDAHPDCKLLEHSPWYRSTALGTAPQADYINGVAALDTSLQPQALLALLQQVERAHGRRRGVRWGARTLDLDILLYGQLTLQQADLRIPHARLRERNFVLQPLFDLAPDLTLPCGTTIASLLARCSREGLQSAEQNCAR